MSERSIGEEGTRYGGGSSFIEEPAGTRIGSHYEVVALLGRGGMGAVYRCHDLDLGRPVALKRILTTGAGGAAGLERFRREAQAVASLNHRNIVIVHEFAEDASGPYLVMELLEGVDLGGMIARRGAMPVADVVDIATQAGAALSYAHRRGVVHRDIKPTNLFRLKDGTVKVVDFGLARVGTDSQLSLEGFGLGTLDYVSPEQRRDATRVDHRSDLFSLGATLYHLTTGKAPRLVRERDLPDELRGVVLSLMEDRPEDRPFSVEEALAPLQTEERVSARRQSAPRRSIDEGTCPTCGAKNPAEARFCHDCGGGLFETCASCQTEGRAGRKYCAKCGRAMAAVRPLEEPAGRLPELALTPLTQAVVTASEVGAALQESPVLQEREAPHESPALQEWVETSPIPAVAPTAPDAEPIAVDHSDPPAEPRIAEPVGSLDEARVLAKVRRRLLPFVFLLYVAVSVAGAVAGFAWSGLQAVLGLSTAALEYGSVAFAIGLFLFAVPSTLILKRVGARIWIACILASCGLVSAGTMFVGGGTSFVAWRFLLGLAEAGFVPGVILYLTTWFPRRHLALAIAIFLAGQAAAGAVVDPLAQRLMALEDLLGSLQGWQWLFLMEGLPAVGLGLLAFAYLPTSPHNARWLTERERKWLQERLEKDRSESAGSGDPARRSAFLDWRVWVLGALNFGLVIGLSIMTFLQAVMVYASVFYVLAYLAIVVVAVAVGHHSDRRAERRWHVAGPALLAALGFLMYATDGGAMWAVLGMGLAAFGVWSARGPFFAMAATVLTESSAAAGIALIVSLGGLADLAGPLLLQRLGRSGGGLGTAALLLAAAIIALIAPGRRAPAT